MIDAGRRRVKFYLTQDYEVVGEDPIWEVLLDHGQGLTAEVEQVPEEKVKPDADTLVARYILRKFREQYQHADRITPISTVAHLVSCPLVAVVHPKYEDGTYGCDTGCEYLRLEATISCPHGEEWEYHYGEFGELAWLIQDLEEEDGKD